MNILHLLKTIAILLAVAAIFGAAMYALNLLTGPIIEKNSHGEDANHHARIIPSFADVCEKMTEDLGSAAIAAV